MSPESPLTKDRLCWVIVRVVGLLFLFWGINLVVFLGAPWLLYGSGLNQPVRITGEVLLQSIVWLLLAYYFLRHGGSVHRLLMYEYPVPGADPVEEKSSLDPQTGMTAEELETFREWRDHNPAVSSLDIENQVARYRNFQASKGS